VHQRPLQDPAIAIAVEFTRHPPRGCHEKVVSSVSGHGLTILVCVIRLAPRRYPYVAHSQVSFEALREAKGIEHWKMGLSLLRRGFAARGAGRDGSRGIFCWDHR
jgi:hypothetical protein